MWSSVARSLEPSKFSQISAIFFRTMSNQDLKDIFFKSVEAVQPQIMIKNELKLQGRHLAIRGQTYELKKPCYVIGFGKAVLGMAVEVEKLLGSNLERGIVSVPTGIFQTNQIKSNSKIKYFEGAQDNLPDENAEKTALKIKELVEGLSENDLLLVLISGGGSALLPLPVPPITLEEKLDLVKKLSRKGATIQELNAVRKRISLLKGGGLADLAHPCPTVCLVLSDILGDPLDFIASGPTVPNADPDEAAESILKKYHLFEPVPDSIKLVLRKGNDFFRPAPVSNPFEYVHVKNYVIGNNAIAAEAAKAAAINKGFQSAIVSTEIDGDVNEISKIYAELARDISKAITLKDKEILRNCLEEISRRLRVRKGFVQEVLDMDLSQEMCLVFAGEPTVVVKGTGKGGRNQQLALAFSVEVNKLGDGLGDISFLSCGTDGVDGPTDAAGALATSDLVKKAQKANMSPEYYLENNDTYKFYEKFQEGECLVKIGHTGTNVMDIHLLLIKPQ